VLTHDRLYYEYHPETVEECLASMTPDKMLVMLQVREDADDDDDAEAEGGATEGDAEPSAPQASDSAGADGAPAAKPKPKPKPQWAAGCICREKGAERCKVHPNRIPVNDPDYLKEPWYDAQYKLEKAEEGRAKAWQAAYEEGRAAAAYGDLSADMAGLASNFHLPVPNEFIPTDFSLRNEAAEEPAPATDGAESMMSSATRARTPPQLLRNTAGGALFFKPDLRFRTPKAFLGLKVACLRRTATPTVEEAVMASLAVELILEGLNETSYAATITGLHYQLEPGDSGFSIITTGFSHKLPVLALRVTEALAAVAAKPVDADLLGRMIEKARQKYQNAGKTSGERVRAARLRCITSPFHTSAAKLAALPGITAAQLDEFLKGDLAPATAGEPAAHHLTVYAAGNLNEDEALAFFDSACEALGAQRGGDPAAPSPDDKPGVWRATPPSVPGCAPEGCALHNDGVWRVHAVSATNAAEKNRSVELLWQLGECTHALQARLDLLVAVMAEPCFDILRTKQQLGYAVDLGQRNSHGILGVCVHVTSSTVNPHEIDCRAREFLQTQVPKIANIKQKVWDDTVEAATTNMLRDDHSLEEEVARFVPEISGRQYVWDRAEKVAAEMQSLSQTDLAEWAKKALLGAQPLSVYAYPGTVDDPEAQPLPPGAMPLLDNGVDDLVSKLEVYRKPSRPMPAVSEKAPTIGAKGVVKRRDSLGMHI
jgi:secreted Zn-dependent insulinase-like peptidase